MLRLAIFASFPHYHPLKHLSAVFRCIPTATFRVTSVYSFYSLKLCKKLQGRGIGNNQQRLATLLRFFFAQNILQNLVSLSLHDDGLQCFSFNGSLFFSMSETAISEFQCSDWKSLQSFSFYQELPLYMGTRPSPPSMQKS